MKARTLTITAVAIFAIAAPAAQANLERILPAKAPVAKHHKVAPTHGSTARPTKVTTSGNRKTGGKTKTTPLYIPGTPNQASANGSTDDCAQSGNTCTDEQLCITWGMNCDLATSSPAPVADSPVVPAVEISASDTASVESAPVASSDPVASSTTDVYTDNSLSYEDC